MDQNLSEDQIREIRKQRLAQLGYPMPMAKPNFMPQVTNVKDPKMLDKINQIRNGGLRQEFAQFRAQTGEQVKPQQKQRGNQSNSPQQGFASSTSGIPALQEDFATPSRVHSEFDLNSLERELYGSSSPTYATPQHGVQMQPLPEDGGRGFTEEFKRKFHSTMQQKQQSQVTNTNNYFEPQPPQHVQQPYQNPIPALQSGMIIINEEDLKKKIINISKQVAKQVSETMIKSVLLEWSKTNGKSTLVETEKVKKAEIIGNGIIKVDGKMYKEVIKKPTSE